MCSIVKSKIKQNILKACVLLIILSIALNTVCSYSVCAMGISSEQANSLNYEETAKRDLLTLFIAYPEYITGVEKVSGGGVYIIMKSGKRLLYDDRKKKNPEEKLANPDLQDMLEELYPLTDITSLMEEHFDPGRIRVYPLLREVYGYSREQVQANLVNVRIGGQNCQFNRNNNAAESLKCVMKELASVMKAKPRIGGFLFPVSGTFNYRVIAGTGRLSPHSFGTAIDLKSDKRDYWKWATRKEGQKRLDSYPREMVQVFENNNFIWGGKWGHFDILHFEYRPELVIKSRYFSSEPVDGKTWYDGAPCDDEKVKAYIQIIENALPAQHSSEYNFPYKKTISIIESLYYNLVRKIAKF